MRAMRSRPVFGPRPNTDRMSCQNRAAPDDAAVTISHQCLWGCLLLKARSERIGAARARTRVPARSGMQPGSDVETIVQVEGQAVRNGFKPVDGALWNKQPSMPARITETGKIRKAPLASRRQARLRYPLGAARDAEKPPREAVSKTANKPAGM